MADVERIAQASRTAGTALQVGQAVLAKLQKLLQAGEAPQIPFGAIVRGTLTAIDEDSLQTLEFPYNPGSIRFRVGASYPEARPFGLTHSLSQYTGTEAMAVSFRLLLDETVAFATAPGNPRAHSVTAIIGFLTSLLYPLRLEEGPLERHRPSRVLLQLGPEFEVTGFLLAVEGEVTRFSHAAPALRPVAASLDLTIREQLERRVSAEEVRERAFRRSFQAPARVSRWT